VLRSDTARYAQGSQVQAGIRGTIRRLRKK